jgi:hypothetical protein
VHARGNNATTCWFVACNQRFEMNMNFRKLSAPCSSLYQQCSIALGEERRAAFPLAINREHRPTSCGVCMYTASCAAPQLACSQGYHVADSCSGPILQVDKLVHAAVAMPATHELVSRGNDQRIKMNSGSANNSSPRRIRSPLPKRQADEGGSETNQRRSCAARAVFLLCMFSKLASAPTLPIAKQVLHDCIEDMVTSIPPVSNREKSVANTHDGHIGNVVGSLCQDVQTGGPVVGLAVRLLWWIAAHASPSERWTAIAAIRESPTTLETLFGFLRHRRQTDSELESATLDLLSVVACYSPPQLPQLPHVSISNPQVRVLLRLLLRSCGHKQSTAASLRACQIVSLLSSVADTLRGYVKLKAANAPTLLETAIHEGAIEPGSRTAIVKLISKLMQWEALYEGRTIQ